jgi:hypothetical protein
VGPQYPRPSAAPNTHIAEEVGQGGAHRAPVSVPVRKLPLHRAISALGVCALGLGGAERWVGLVFGCQGGWQGGSWEAVERTW